MTTMTTEQRQAFHKQNPMVDHRLSLVNSDFSRIRHITVRRMVYSDNFTVTVHEFVKDADSNHFPVTLLERLEGGEIYASVNIDRMIQEAQESGLEIHTCDHDI